MTNVHVLALNYFTCMKFPKIFEYIRIFEYFWYSNIRSNNFQNSEYIRYSYSVNFDFTNIFDIRIRVKKNIRCNTGLDAMSQRVNGSACQ